MIDDALETGRLKRDTASTPKSQAKRDAIMAAATSVLNARTYGLATMNEIAAELQLRDGTLYYYFPSKQALFFACHLRSIARIDQLLATSEAEGGTGAVKIKRSFFPFVDNPMRNGPLLYFGDYFHLEAGQRSVVSREVEKLASKLERFLKLGVADGSIVECETRLVVRLLMGMLIWLPKWTPTIDDLTPETLLSAMGLFSLHGLKARPGGVQASR